MIDASLAQRSKDRNARERESERARESAAGSGFLENGSASPFAD